MRKIRRKLLAWVLSIAMVLSCIPITAFAVGNVTNNSENAINDSQAQEATIIAEVTEKRDTNKKVYLLSDGSYMAATYTQQVHYKENGKWEDIDNSFISSVDDNGESTIENTKNAFKIKFANKSKNKKLVSLKKDGYEINWALDDGKKVSVEAIDSDKTLNTPASLKNINSAVVYKNILADTDLKYTINSTTIKEDIILNSSNASTAFTFNYEIKKLAYHEAENGDIEIYSNNEPDKVVFLIEKPFMYDAVGNYSDSVEMQLTATKKGFQLMITPNAEWVNSDDRVFPIVIDPTIVTEQSASAVKDTTGVLSEKTNQLYNALETNNNYLWLKVGKFYGTEAYSLIYVPLPDDISETSRIINAKLNLICYRSGISTATSNLTITAHEITTNWNAATINDNKILYGDELPEYNSSVADFIILNDSTSAVHNQLYSFDITKIAQKWATGESTNYGILLAGQNLPTTERYMRFYDSDNSLRNSDPCFTYTYRDTKGIEDYWTYTTMTAGHSGTAAVNNFNGNLVVTQNITGISGSRMPVSIAAVYDSGRRTINSCNMGNGWKINYDMRICTSILEGFPYYLIDSDGTEHYFYGETTDTEWEDEDGLGYTLKKDSSVSENGYLITDKAKNKSYFRSDGKLVKMVDTLGNNITINHDSSSRISSITDGSGRNYSFAYNSSGLLSSITNPANKTVSFTYSNNNLTAITYADLKSTTFTYGTNGLDRVTSSDGTYTTFSYTLAAKHLYVSAMEFYGSDGTLNSDYDFKYKHNATLLTSDCNNTVNHTLQFDNFGKTVGVVNNITKTAEYYSYGAPGGYNTGNENKLLSASSVIRSSVTYYNDNDSYSDTTKWYVDPEATDTEMSIDNTKGRSTAPSLKISQTNEYGGYSAVIYDAGVLKGGYNYDFSAFINTNGAVLDAPYGISAIVYHYNTEYDKYGSMGGTIATTFEDDWIYSNSQISFEEDQHCYVVIGGYFNSPATFWVDDLQIQLGEGVRDYNHINNNVFLDGAETWTYKRNGNVATDNSVSYYEANCCLVYGSYTEKRSVSQTVNCKGVAGDSLVFGAWALGHSVPTNVTKEGLSSNSTFRVRIELTGPNGNAVFNNGENIADFNCALDERQFATGTLIAPIDFTNVTFYLDYDYNANYAMFQIPFVYKENYGQSYTYDSNGNVVSSKDLAETEATFAYQENNLSQMINPTGSRYSYAYNEDTNLLKYANSSNGQLFEFVYDQYGNVLSSTITASQNATALEGGSLYYIRNVTTGNAMKNVNSLLVNGTYATQNNAIRWKLISAGETDVYYIQPAGDSENYLTVKDGSTADKAQIILSAIANSDSQKFKITLNNDGSFAIYSKVSNYSKVIDGRDLNNNSSTELGKNMVQNAVDSTTGNQKWYFEKYVVNSPTQEKIVTSATYTADGNYVSTETDAYGNTVSYQYNNDGTVSDTTDAKNVQTSYSYYENSGELRTVTSGNSTNTYTYENDRVKTITTANGTVYTFNYDAFGRNTSIDLNRVGSTATARRLVTYEYNSQYYDERNLNGSRNNLYQVIYGNGSSYDLTYDSSGRLSMKGSAWYYYDRNGNLTIQSPGGNDLGFIYYYYDLSGRLVNKTMNSDFDGWVMYSMDYKYLNQKNLLDRYRFSSGTTSWLTSFIYGDINKGQIADATYGLKLNNVLRLGYTYDKLGRQNSRTLYTNANSITKTYTFKNGTVANTTGCLIDTVTENGYTYRYVYDALGNITSYTKTKNSTNSVVESYIYRYDDKGQLIFAGTNETNGTEYTYDLNGNILTKKNLATNTTISYGYNDSTWADLLTSYNGQSITYDEIGNPLNYYDGKVFTWIDGRRLETVTNGDEIITYGYDGEGIRTSKIVGDVYTTYMILDGVMYGEYSYTPDGEIVIYYLYDENGTKYGFSYNDTLYYYQYNLQGDVTGIYDSNGQLVVEYTYDEWGKVLSITGTLADTVGQINPIRYRGYYYDNETGFYYLQSRYYDAETGRFINADGAIAGVAGEILGYNQFAYCFNNPVNLSDETGNWPEWIKNAAKWTTKNIAKPIVNTAKKLLSKIDRTYSKGYNITLTPSAVIFSFQGGVSIDTKGNVAIQGSFTGGFTGGSPSASFTTYDTITNAPNIDKLNGFGCNIGGSIGAYGLTGGAEINIIPDDIRNKTYWGRTTSIGAGVPGGEAHVEFGNTGTINKTTFNIFDVVNNFFDDIMEW